MRSKVVLLIKTNYQGLGGRENEELMFNKYIVLILQNKKVLKICCTIM